jgi:hypothetical protein
MKRKLSAVLPPDAFKGEIVVPFPKEKLELATEDGRPGQLFRFRLRNGFVGLVSVPDAQADVLWRGVQSPSEFHYVLVLDSFKRRIALNMRHVVASQFDRIVSEAGLPEGAWIDDGETVDIIFADSPSPLSLDIEEDWMTVDGFDKGGVDDNDACQLGNLFHYFRMAHEGSDDVERLRDADGAIIWLRINEISLATVPLSLLPPDKSRKKTKSGTQKRGTGRKVAG